MKYETIPKADKEDSFLYAVNQSIKYESVRLIHINVDMDFYSVVFMDNSLYYLFIDSMKKFGYEIEGIHFDLNAVNFREVQE